MIERQRAAGVRVARGRDPHPRLPRQPQCALPRHAEPAAHGADRGPGRRRRPRGRARPHRPGLLLGMDLSEAAGGGAQDQGVREFPDLLEAIWSSPKPVVAVVRGPARAGGVGLLAACAVVVAGASATFAFSEVRLGIVPAVISAVVLPRMVPHVAHRLMLTGQIFDAEVAVDGGLVDLVVPDADVDGEVRAQLVHLTAGRARRARPDQAAAARPDSGAGLRRAARAVGPLLRQRGGPGGHRVLPREAPGPLGAHRRLTARRWGSREAATPRREPREIPPRPG